MAHDANFVDNRLRLTTFLRVVEHGIPSRPSRFKRRAQILDQNRYASDTVSPAQTNMMSTSVASQTTSSTTNSASPGTAADILPIEHDQAEPCAHEETIYDIPHSPTPTELRLSPAFDDSQNAHRNGNSVQQIQRRAEIARPAKTRKEVSKPLGASSNRRRRSPVNGLALLRTTTLDGLPEPGDADVTFAASIAVIDPIEDSQVPKSLNQAMLRVKSLQGVVISKPKLSLCMVPQPQAGTLHTSRSKRSPIKAHHRLAASFNNPLPRRMNFQVASDGFVGTELESTSKRRPNRRGETASTEGKKPPVLCGLVLGSGLLPLAAVETIETSTAPRHANTQSLDHLKPVSGLEYSQDNARSGRIVLARSQSGMQSEVSSQRLPEERERAVRHQLSSITAPIRRESDSSESDSATEECSMIIDEGDDMDDTDSASDVPYFPQTRAPTSVDDASYFETAMQHLEVEGSVESGDRDFWSQYNAMN